MFWTGWFWAENVRQVLRYVESGAAAAGLVYETDVAAARGLAVVERLDPGDTGPIRYVAARPRASQSPMEADEFLRFLVGQQGQAAFAAAGFGPIETKAAN